MNFEALIQQFKDVRVMVIGDLMLDAYYFGSVERISPEAPVPIVNVIRREERLGGAGNVALNIRALGGIPVLCSIIGNDAAGIQLMDLLQKESINSASLLVSDEKITTQKTRIIGNNAQMLRVDEENTNQLSEELQERFLQLIAQTIREAKPGVIIFEDYDKGTINKHLIEQIVELASEENIPVAVDPKKRNFLNYKGVSLFKPNLKELKEGLGVDIQSHDRSSVSDAVKLLRSKMPHTMTMLTLSEKGMYICNESEEYFIDAHLRNISDVSGAGDTVIAIASLCMAAGADIRTLAELSNLGGGMVCEYPGVVAIQKDDLIKETKRISS